jgi:hypothetical protein
LTGAPPRDDVIASPDRPKVPTSIRNAVARKTVAIDQCGVNANLIYVRHSQCGDYDRARLVVRARLELGLERPLSK